MNCPCQSGSVYDQCCGRFISHQALADNAEQLMRSRYTAYVLLNIDYLKQTWHIDYRPQDLVLDKALKWIKLDVLAVKQEDDRAEIEFEARFLVSGKVEALHERSRFVREQGRWLYTNGEMLTPSFQPIKPGRNERCPCGSGKKFKRCCGS